VTGLDIAERRVAAIARQRRAVDEPAPLFIEACPGSGKTRVIIDRHLAHSVPSASQGRALVSFTRASTTELRQRWERSHRPELAEYPHFIGTIDRFLWQFLVRPACTHPDPAAPERRWEHLESWDGFPTQVPGGWHLADFTFRREPGQDSCRAELRKTERNRTWHRSRTTAQHRAAERAALALRDELWGQGYVTGHEIRIMALRNAIADVAGTCTNVIARFGELVIDEVQDCSALDLAILRQLHAVGLPLVMVGDLDQAIYAFREARPTETREFARALGTRVELNGNWRSSPAICAFAHTLKGAHPERSPDDPVGAHHDEPTPVLLLTSRKNRTESACQQFHDRAAALAIAPEQRLITAHAASRLPASTRWRTRGAELTGVTKQLVWAATMLRHDPTPAHLEQALTIVERALLRVWLPVDTDGASIEALCADQSIDRRDLRRHATTLPLPDPTTGTLRDWCTRANEVLRATAPADHLTAGRRGKLTATGPSAAREPRDLIDARPPAVTALAVRNEVIHQVKGTEAEAVLLVIPDTQRTEALVASWERGIAAEEEGLRVLYVAATRARRLLAVCVPDIYAERAAHLLREHQVPYIEPGRGPACTDTVAEAG